MRVLMRLAPATIGGLLILAVFASSRAQSPGSSIALTGARLIDGTGGAPIEQASLLVTNGRIEAAGAAAAVTIPPGTTQIDLSGKTIVPGFINAHGHVDASPGSTVPIREQLLVQLRTYARYGITTAYSLGSTPADMNDSLALRDEQARGPIDRARLYTAGQVVADKTPEDARKTVDRLADAKVDIIKIRVDGPDGSPGKMTPDIYQAVIDQAHKRGLRVTAHLFYLSDARGLLNAGVDQLAHSVRDQEVDAALIAELKRRNIAVIPTLARELSVFVYESTPAFFNDPFFLWGQRVYGQQVEQLKDPARQEKTRNNPDAQAIKKALEQASRNLKVLSDAGVPIAMGTDTGANLMGRWQGYFEHVELELMVMAGLTPMQALVSATGGAARAMKLDGHLGTLQPGKSADLLVLNGNPLTDIRNTRRIDSVWVGGRRLDAGN